jgi:hypothetical protein
VRQRFTTLQHVTYNLRRQPCSRLSATLVAVHGWQHSGCCLCLSDVDCVEAATHGIHEGIKVLTSNSCMAASDAACVRTSAMLLLAAQATCLAAANSPRKKVCKARSTSSSTLKISRRRVVDVSLPKSCQQ